MKTCDSVKNSSCLEGSQGSSQEILWEMEVQ